MIRIIFLIHTLAFWSVYSQEKFLMQDTSVYEDEIFEDVAEQELTVDELIDEVTIRNGEKIFSKPNIDIRSRVKRQMYESRGYRENIFIGTPIYSYQRIKVGNKIIEGGLLLKKDPGERYYDDFLNYYIQLNNSFLIRKIIVGDYVIESGQGLFFWRRYYFAKGVSFNETIIRKGKGLQAYSSSDEIGFLRGFAVDMDLKYFRSAMFFSSKKLTSAIDTNGCVKNFYLIYYRTQSDLLKKNNTAENVYGLRLYRSFDNILAGFTITKNVYSRPIRVLNTNTYFNVGFDGLIDYENLKFATESYLNNMKYLNSCFVIKIIPVKDINYVLLFRNYSAHTFNRFSNPFGEYYQGKDENGLFVGINWKISKQVLLRFYTDYFKALSLNGLHSKKDGNEFLIQVNYAHDSKITFQLRYCLKRFKSNNTIEDYFGRKTKINDLFSKQKIRFNLDYKIIKNLIYRFRIEYIVNKNIYEKNIEYGRMYFHDIFVKSFWKLSINFRVTYFFTDSYDSGINVYERDFDGVIANPILYGRGMKWYFVLKYQVKDFMSFSLKYSYLVREDVKKIGTGLDQLPSNVDERIGLQLDINL